MKSKVLGKRFLSTAHKAEVARQMIKDEQGGFHVDTKDGVLKISLWLGDSDGGWHHIASVPIEPSAVRSMIRELENAADEIEASDDHR